MDQIFTESTIEDSFIYKNFNASNSLVEKMVKYIKTGIVLDTGYFEEQYMQMKKNVISPLTPKVINSFDNGEIELLYSKETKIGTSIPFIIRKNEKGKIVATIFIATFTNIDKQDNLTIPVKQLYALMESAYVALQMQVNPMKVQRNVALMRICTSTYTAMLMRILNKLYALTLDKMLYDKVVYTLSRFFLEKVWEYPNSGLIESYAEMEIHYLEDIDLDLLKQSYQSAQIKDINDLILFLKTLSPRMSDINTRFFIEQYVNTFHGSSIMSLDYLPYLFFVIINVLLSSFLISQTALNDIIKNVKNMNKFYSELAKTI